MPRTNQAKSKKKKSWGQKKKKDEEGVRKKSINVGLPGSFIKAYGKPVQRALISATAWDTFYKSTPGQARANALASRHQKKFLKEGIQLTQAFNGQVVSNDAALKAVVTNNETAKLNARK
jgi:hypothetical protein